MNQVIANNQDVNETALVKTKAAELDAREPGLLKRQDTVSSNLLTLTDHLFTDMVTRYAGHAGPDGKAASSPGGFKTQINRRIKSGYGCKREDMTGAMKQHCNLLLDALRDVLSQGMAANENRSAIKARVWAMIDLFVGQWREIEKIKQWEAK